MWSSIPKNSRWLILGVLSILGLWAHLGLMLACVGCFQACTETGDMDAGSSDATAMTKSSATPTQPGQLVRKLEQIKGVVEWKSPKNNQWQRVYEGQDVPQDADLRSGPDSSFVVVFGDGAKLKIEGEGGMSLKDAADRPTFIMESGEIRVSVDGDGKQQYQLVFGESGEMLMIRDGQAGVKIDPKTGERTIEMIMGQAVISRSGSDVSVEKGQKFIMSIGSGSVILREVLPTQLNDRKRTTLIRTANSKKFRRINKRQTQLDPGTELRTSSKGRVSISDNAGGVITLESRASAVFDGSYRSREGREGNLRLESGAADINLQRGLHSSTSQEVITPLARIVTKSLGTSSHTQIFVTGKSTKVAVHTGQAQITVGEKTVLLKAGELLNIGKRSKNLRPTKDALPAIVVQEGKRTRVFYDRKPSRIGLRFKPAPENLQATLEVSSSSAFQEISFAEPTDRPWFILYTSNQQNIFWRIVRVAQGAVQPAVGPVGSVHFKRDPITYQRIEGRLASIVPDTGIKTTVLYQGELPELVFTWKEVNGAKDYRIRVYSEDDLSSPVLDERSLVTKIVFSSGKLSDGTYFWYQASFDQNGKQLKASEMNKLEIRFDNATPLLRIDSPYPGQRIKRGRITLSGMALPGAKIKVANQPIAISFDGRFRDSVNPRLRDGMIVFQLIKDGLGDVFFTRHVTR